MRNNTPSPIQNSHDPTHNAADRFGDIRSHSGIPQEAQNDYVYDQKTIQNMSSKRAHFIEDIAQETHSVPSPSQPQSFVDHQAQHDIAISTTAATNHPANQGEQSVSGTAADPESNDDTLANAQAVGFQPNEDSEHPQEIDAARDIDNAEEYIRTH